jgi:hypothetical protein
MNGNCRRACVKIKKGAGLSIVTLQCVTYQAANFILPYALKGSSRVSALAQIAKSGKIACCGVF